MPLLRMSVHEFVDRCQQDTVADDLAECHRQARLGRLEDGEIRSWRNSLPALARVLDEAGLQHVEVLIEYQLALSSLRADVVLAGWHPGTVQPSYVIVELKQWTHARALPEEDPLPAGERRTRASCIRRPGTGVLRVPADYRLSPTPTAVAGVAYLHNAVDVEAGPVRPRADALGRLSRSSRDELSRTCVAPVPDGPRHRGPAKSLGTPADLLALTARRDPGPASSSSCSTSSRSRTDGASRRGAGAAARPQGRRRHRRARPGKSVIALSAAR